ncbi:ABC transporter F family member 4-like isoform X2 [Pectinophora gossypiella]|uniref:ABC transporter F family member 4-like isoform X2 n=1 Tax=Pectinophora gossypiella TaxID=13191 RepID=UPI00214E0322|nr:ABC transporter F family member 4-like isoform X2 [Pectinophora gossypiella]
MSQIVTRKGGVTDEKDKSRTDSPVKEMKKKMAANAEKEKQAAEKNSEKVDKTTEKPKQTEKPAEKPKPTEKSADKPKQPEKSVEKTKQSEKAADKPKQNEKHTEKPADKSTDKKVEKNGVDNKKTETKDNKKETQEKKEDKVEKNGKADTKKNGAPKQNGKHNGETNGVFEETASEDEVIEIADEEFPELAYDEGSDTEAATPESAPSRSATRRSQSKDSKLLKLKEDASTERKLRSADSPKRDTKKDTPKKEEKGDKEKKGEEKENGQKDKVVLDVVVDVEQEEEPRKPDTNYSKSRVKVSPYRRSLRSHDHTASSVMANYTGNNTTMEMDITETSLEEPSLDDSSYLSGLRTIRGRRSYKPLKEMALKHVPRTTAHVSVSEPTRPTGTVVGRKRKPEADDSIEVATEAGETGGVLHGKRMRLLERIAMPFRRTVASTPLPRRNADIVGINTDLPLTAPVASADTFDPETLKTSPPSASAPAPQLTVTPPTPDADMKDNKRCIVM